MRPWLFLPEVQETTAMGAVFAVGVGKNKQTRYSSPVEGNLRKQPLSPPCRTKSINPTKIETGAGWKQGITRNPDRIEVDREGDDDMFGDAEEGEPVVVDDDESRDDQRKGAASWNTNGTDSAALHG